MLPHGCPDKNGHLPSDHPDHTDPMLELAKTFLLAERPDADETGKFPQDIYNRINEEIQKIVPEATRRKMKMPPRQLQQILWESRDERAQEVLADLFYAKPTIAKRLCEVRPDACPAFICYLVNEAREEWQRGITGKEQDSRRKKLHDLFEKYHYDVHETFPDKLQLSLVANHVFMETLADHLKVPDPEKRTR